MTRNKALRIALKVTWWSLVILSVLIYNFIANDERDMYKEKAELVEAKYEGSLDFLKEYKIAVDSIITQKQDSIELLLKRLED